MSKALFRFGVAVLLTTFCLSCSPQSKESGSDSAAEIISVRVDSVDVMKMAYCLAIAEYINSSFQADSLPDTLFIGKHNQFPEIKLPFTIQNVNILLLTDDEYKMKTLYRAHSEFINMIHTRQGNHWEFKFVVFYDYAYPQHNFYVEYDYVPVHEDFVYDTSYFEFAYSAK